MLNLEDGSTRLLSDGQSRYSGAVWAPDASRFGYTTTQRNGRSWDIHVQDLEGNSRSVLDTDTGSWGIEDWSDDGLRMLVSQYISINESYLYELSLATGELLKLVEKGQAASFGRLNTDRTERFTLRLTSTLSLCNCIGMTVKATNLI